MCWYLFPINNFCRGALILLKARRRIYHCKIQVKFDISNHPQNFGWVIALFRLSFCYCVDIGFHSITFAGMHWFYWKLAEGYIIVKYKSSSILVIILKILGKLWPFFDLVTFRDRSDYKNQCFFLFFFSLISNGCRFKQATHPILGILVEIDYYDKLCFIFLQIMRNSRIY